jgi:SAM-dependent methyltransferase
MSAPVIDYYGEGALSTVFYDLLSQFDPSIQGDLDVYAALAEGRRTVLELGCGSGRIAQALAERGLAVTGVDLAPAMLDKAKQRRRAAPQAVARRLRYRLGDMAALDLGDRFDLVVAPYFGLAHLELEAQARAFGVMARHLAEGGLAALHLPVAARMAEAPPPTDQPVVSITFDPQGRQLRLYVAERRFDPGSGRFDQTIAYVVVDAEGAELRRSLERMVYFVGDSVGMAAAAGLILDRTPEPLNEFGDLFVFRASKI